MRSSSTFFYSVRPIVVTIVCCNPKHMVKRNSVFHMNISAGLTSLDPAFSKDQATMWCDNQIFNGLVQIDDTP